MSKTSCCGLKCIQPSIISYGENSIQCESQVTFFKKKISIFHGSGIFMRNRDTYHFFCVSRHVLNILWMTIWWSLLLLSRYFSTEAQVSILDRQAIQDIENKHRFNLKKHSSLLQLINNNILLVNILHYYDLFKTMGVMRKNEIVNAAPYRIK